MEVPLEPPSLLVLRGDESLARRPELFDRVQQILGEGGVPHHESSLRGQIPDELLLGRRERLPRPLLDREGAKQLATMTDRLEQRRSWRRSSVDWTPPASRRRARVLGPRSPPDRSSLPTRTHTSARAAPLPSPSARAILGRSSSFAYVCPTRSENSESTSYGVARFP